MFEIDIILNSLNHLEKFIYYLIFFVCLSVYVNWSSEVLTSI